MGSSGLVAPFVIVFFACGCIGGIANDSFRDLSANNAKSAGNLSAANVTSSTLKPVHNACSGGKCVQVKGKGPDDCYNNRDCFHWECQNQKCVIVRTKGPNTCKENVECTSIWGNNRPSGQKRTGNIIYPE